jgi:thioredoxin 1
MATNANVIEVGDDDFEREVLAAELPVLVDFVAPWCGPCKALAPVVARVASENAGTVKVVTVDTEASPRTAQRYGVRGVPTLLVFRKGERTAAHVGVATKEKVLALLGAD